jgi:hypothetical protein
MGDESARQELMRSVASSSESDAQVVQTYLRYYPVTDRGQLRAMAREVSQASGPAQVRGIDAIGRLNISDREVLRELSTMFAQSHSLEVQRALAELFIRSDPAARRARPRRHAARAPAARLTGRRAGAIRGAAPIIGPR